MADRPGARLVAEFAAALRRGGLEVPPGTSVLFAQALAAVGLADRDLAYWAGRATLVRRPEDREAYDRVFAEFFECRLPAAPRPRQAQVTLAVDSGEDGGESAGPDPATESEATLALRYSATEVLREQDFSRYGEEEWAEARRLISAMRAKAEQRRSRRLRPHARRGRLDLARTVQMALSSDGEAIRRAFAAPADRPRRLVIIVDISGSMEPYARAFLRFAHAALVARPAGAVEVFVLSTRVSRITRQLSSRDPDEALAAASAAVDDWYGGTRLGEGLASFNDRWGTRGLARGAVVVLLSDGWDRGEPDGLAAEMGRLRRVAHRIVWANPLRASPGYEPIARGMAAALPFVDDFVDGHSLASLEHLVEVVAGAPR